MTNRGCLTPVHGDTQDQASSPAAPLLVPGTGILFRVDYLKVTLFEPDHEALRIVDETLLERAGFEAQWVNKGPVMRWAAIYEAPGPVNVLVPKDSRRVYSVIEVKGHGCTLFGPDVLQGFMRSLIDSGIGWHGLRVDLAFDHVGFTPMQVHESILRGDFNSRCFKLADRDWHDNETGRTAYLGRRNDKNKTRRLRVYDMRGYTRCEGEFKSDWATSVIRKLATTPLDAWPLAGLSYIRGMVEFIDATANARPERCPPLDWWSGFVGSVDRIRNLSEEDRRKQQEQDCTAAIGKSEGRIMRAARSLWAIRQAFGDDYVLERMDHYAQGRITEEDERLVTDLKRYRYSGYAGLPLGRPDDEPPI